MAAMGIKMATLGFLVRTAIAVNVIGLLPVVIYAAL